MKTGSLILQDSSNKTCLYYTGKEKPVFDHTKQQLKNVFIIELSCIESIKSVSILLKRKCLGNIHVICFSDYKNIDDYCNSIYHLLLSVTDIIIIVGSPLFMQSQHIGKSAKNKITDIICKMTPEKYLCIAQNHVHVEMLKSKFPDRLIHLIKQDNWLERVWGLCKSELFIELTNKTHGSKKRKIRGDKPRTIGEKLCSKN